MAQFSVEFTATVFIEADSKEEAENRAWDYANTGVIDITDCYTSVEEVHRDV